MDLTLLGVGTAIGIGIYVMTAKLLRENAGPTVILSIVLASVSVLLSGICYAEFSSRIPKCGSAYVYCYAALGEIWAFVVGLTMIVEYVLATAVLARTCSEYIDFIFGGKIYNFFKEEVVTWNNHVLAPFPDFLALVLAITAAVIVAMGMRWTMILNRTMFVFSFIALILLFVISLFLVRPENWAHNFAPYGIQDVLRAAASGYYTFIGLDVITSASGEALSPRSSVPLSIILTVTMVTVIYCGLATVFTLIAPYNQLGDLATLATIFQVIPGAEYVAAVGAISATVSGMLSCLIAGSRVSFNMADDGLLFKCCIIDPSRTINNVILARGFISGCLAALFTTEHLVRVCSSPFSFYSYNFKSFLATF